MTKKIILVLALILSALATAALVAGLSSRPAMACDNQCKWVDGKCMCSIQ